jgi:filamentous hemagglutinin
LTKTGRALQKHGGRSDSVFPKPRGNISSINQCGQDILDNILTHPDSKISFWKHRRFGDVIDISIPGQGGTRFLQNGEFIGFLEP